MPIPRPCVVTDLVTDTTFKLRRTRFFWTTDVAPTGITDLEAICNRLMAVIPPLLAPMMTTQAKMLRFEGKWYGPGTSGWEGNSTVAAVPGENPAVTPGSETEAEEGIELVADTLPDEVSMVIQKRTGNTGRSQMGRWFFTGLSEKINNHGRLTSTWVATAKNIANALSADVTVSGAYATVLHARHYDQKNSVLMPITKCYVLRTLGTRLDRRRPLEMERA